MNGALPRLEAMTVGMALDYTFRIYARNFPLILGLTAVTYGPLYILKGLMTGGLIFGMQFDAMQETPSDEALQALGVFVILGLIVFLVWQVVIYPLTTGALTLAVSKRFLNEDITIRDAYRGAFRRFGTLIWSYIVVGLMALLGLLLCFIPGIILLICFSLLTPVIMLEGMASADSRARAWNLLDGYRWHAFGVLFVLWLITVVVNAGFGLVSYIALPLGPEIHLAASWLANVASGLLTGPLLVIGPILLYYNARICKEGFDLEMLAADIHQEFGETED